MKVKFGLRKPLHLGGEVAKYSKTRVFENWQHPLPGIDQHVSFGDGTLYTVVHVEWDLSENGLSSVLVVCE